jgi:hypothetical protein
VDFPKLARSFADPNAEREYLDWQIKHGVIAPIDLLSREYPTMSTEQLLELQQANLNDYARLNDWITSRNLRINPDTGAVEGATTITGRVGGQGPSSDEQDNE